MRRLNVVTLVATLLGSAVASPATAGVYELVIEEKTVNVTGRDRTAMAINGTVPGPVLRWREGEEVTINVTNRLRESTSIHWHGILLPARMDGVPGLSFDGIAPGQTFTYRFTVRQSGTYWYHSHSGLQEQSGVYAPLIIDPATPPPYRHDREYVVMLSDWTDEDPHRVMGKLKKQAGYYNFQKRTVADFARDVRTQGWKAAVADRLAWSRMRMDPTDIADVTGYTYTFLVNGQSPAGNWTALFEPGERVRLRFINAAAMTYFDVRIPGLTLEVVQADGQDVEPVAVEEFRIAVSETYDVIVEPREARAYTIFAEAMDRSGHARGTLAPRPGMAGPIPPLRQRPIRTMADMGMDHGTAGHGAMDRGTSPGPRDKQPMDHGATGGGHPATANQAMGDGQPGGQPTDRPTMGHGAMGHGQPGGQPADTSGMDHGAMGHQQQDDQSAGTAPVEGRPAHDRATDIGRPPHEPGKTVTNHGAASGALQAPVPHGPDDHGPGNSMIAMMPRSRLHEPGAGLEDADRRVLLYTDLRSREPGYDRRPPEREIELHLTGNMDRFIWGFDGKRFSEADPVRLRLGERVRMTIVNDTMMEHPIHLHGMWMELDNGSDARNPRKFTINVKPGERLSFLLTADAPGAWAFHCHLLYHMDAGMMLAVVVSEESGR